MRKNNTPDENITDTNNTSKGAASLAALIGSMEDIGTNFLLKFWQITCHLFPFMEMARGLQEEIWEK